ncbi:hypothetical protein Nepgr_010524 [Nepenthes gracilis]|uniref:Uncharacterized protein n=1 Tax=Nepenthes gracilis TaxID=150966 RepID=A0AAD3XLE9_NEPGR|nr:hypothetical protein Nepgr_010524 [Nepenthes gracilis]
MVRESPSLLMPPISQAASFVYQALAVILDNSPQESGCQRCGFAVVPLYWKGMARVRPQSPSPVTKPIVVPSLTKILIPSSPTKLTMIIAFLGSSLLYSTVGVSCLTRIPFAPPHSQLGTSPQAAQPLQETAEEQATAVVEPRAEVAEEKADQVVMLMEEAHSYFEACFVVAESHLCHVCGY